jgi:hypothetical protein
MIIARSGTRSGMSITTIIAIETSSYISWTAPKSVEYPVELNITLNMKSEIPRSSEKNLEWREKDL